MPNFLRILLTGSAFLVFFVTGGIMGRLMLPLVANFPGSPARKRRRREAFLLFANRWFVGYMRLLGLIRFKRPPLPPDLPPPGQPYVLIANHPTLIDVLLPLTMLPGLTSLFKPSWYRSWLIRPLLQYGHHIAGPDPRALPAGDDDGETSESPVLDRMVAHLESGHPLFVFPEGSRSFERRLRRFRRGAVEAAIRAQVPIVPIFISVNPVMLMKHQPWYVVPRKGGRYAVEFFPVIHTAGKQLDAREVNRQLRERYEERHARMLQERDAEAPPSTTPTLPASPGVLPRAPTNTGP
jgi:1-acyl-sn-glycerol-3-phosphate acyltransferase